MKLKSYNNVLRHNDNLCISRLTRFKSLSILLSLSLMISCGKQNPLTLLVRVHYEIVCDRILAMLAGTVSGKPKTYLVETEDDASVTNFINFNSIKSYFFLLN